MGMPQAWEGDEAVSEQRYIVIPNWRKFQHYKERTPKWIKIYTDLLHDPNYLALNGRHRGILHGIWMLYAASNQELLASPSMLNHQLGFQSEWMARARRVSGESVGRAWVERGEAPIRMRDIERLEKAGFIELLLAPVERFASLEVEVDKEKNFKKEERSKTNHVKAEAAIRTMIENGVITDEVDLTAELNGYDLNGDSAERLRALLLDGATPSTPDDDIPF